MNTNKILRYISRTRKFYVNHEEFKSLIYPGSRNMSMNVSISHMDKVKQTFQNSWQDILHSLATNKKMSQLPEVSDWVQKVLEYNLAGGKKFRGMTTVLAYEMLEKPENITEDSLKLIHVAGWCTEMLQSYFLIIDDIMDGSTTRRGVPCWFRNPNIGMGALNDCILIYSSLCEILKTYFGNTPQHIHIMELFNETLLYTSMGQHLDYTMAHRNKNDYSQFTIDRYESIVKYKTAYYTIKLPVFLALLLRKDGNKTPHELIENICLSIGELFQIQDDILDCYGDTTVTGKAGTDIQEGKCTWLAVQALQNCNQTQRALFEENYASPDPDKVERIKQLYEELQLKDLYKKLEIAKYKSILDQLKLLPSDTSPAIFFKLLEILSQRKH